MKKLYYLFPALVMSVAMVSCDKETTTPSTPTTPTNTSPTAATPTINSSKVSGALISIQMKYSSQPAGVPMPVELNTEIGTAMFYATPGASDFTDAGTVSVNSNNLEKAANNAYTKLAYIGGTPSDLDFDGGSNWNIAGSGTVTAFTYNHTSSFPKYTGDVPTSVTKSSGVTFTFNSSTLSGADSVLVLVAAGSVSVTKTYGVKAGTVTISAADLSALPTVTDNSGIIEVCPYNWVEVTKNGKNYVAIKEQAVVKNININ